MATRCTQITEETLANENSVDAKTEKMVTETWTQLKQSYKTNGKEAINYFRFVIDPDSFGNTLENVFYVSFLVREGKVKVIKALSGTYILGYYFLF